MKNSFLLLLCFAVQSYGQAKSIDSVVTCGYAVEINLLFNSSVVGNKFDEYFVKQTTGSVLDTDKYRYVTHAGTFTTKAELYFDGHAGEISKNNEWLNYCIQGASVTFNSSVLRGSYIRRHLCNHGGKSAYTGRSCGPWKILWSK